MKRARVNTRSEAALARARPCLVSSDALLAMLDDADVTVGQLCASTSALASLTADMVARSNESVTQTTAQVNPARSALFARKTRVLGIAKRLSRKQCKKIVAEFEAAAVSKEQLRVWAGVAGAGTAGFSASPLLTSQPLVHPPAIRVLLDPAPPVVGEFDSVITCEGLRVASAAGPGLKWFEPHSRNEFTVVLAHADGSVPVWLTTADVVVNFLSSGGTPAAAVAMVSSAAVIRSEWAGQDTASVAYWGLSEEAPEAVMELCVCGLPVADATGDLNWCVRVPRKPLAGHTCAAVGTHVRTLAVVEGRKYGMAVSSDEKWLVVGLVLAGSLCVYSLPGVELVRKFGWRGEGPLQFDSLGRLCFAPNGHLIVVDGFNRRLQEVTLEGVFVRCMGVGSFSDRRPSCVAVHNDVIAVGCCGGTGPRVVLFTYGTGAVMSRYGEVGTAPCQLSEHCTSIRFTFDGSHVIVAEWEAKRLSLFTTAGEFVKCVGVGFLGGDNMDVLLSASGEYVVADSDKSRVCVFSPDCSELARRWGSYGTGNVQFQFDIVLAAAGRHLYVMDGDGGRVQVFD